MKTIVTVATPPLPAWPDKQLQHIHDGRLEALDATILMANYLAWEFMVVEPLKHIKVEYRGVIHAS